MTNKKGFVYSNVLRLKISSMVHIHRYLINLVKNNKIIYSLLFYIASSALKIAGLFIKSNKNEIVIVCYGGRKYGDNVKPIYLKMLNDHRFDKWRFVWAFRNVNEFVLPDNKRSKIIKIDTLSFFYHLLCAKCWLTNNTVQRGLDFKNKNTVYINTWHGVPLKKIGDCFVSNELFNSKSKEEFDLCLAEGTYDADIYSKAFIVKNNNIKITGYPRNDVMFEKGSTLGNRVKEKYGIYGKKVILYAPTYRDYIKDESGAYSFECMITPQLFKDMLGDDYVMLVRTHGAIEKELWPKEGFVDVSDYPDVEDLMVAADILVSDYSGIIFDYSLLEKPILCFTYDLDLYKNNRGLFVELEDFMPFKQCKTERELYQSVLEIDYKEARRQCIEFRKQCGLVKEHATDNALNEIYSLIG